MRSLVIVSGLLLMFVARLTFAQQTVITGTVLGSDNKPLSGADVRLTVAPDKMGNDTVNTEVASDGHFKITTNQTGLLNLNFNGVNHYDKSIPLILGQPTTIEINVKLEPYKYKEDIKSIQVMGDFIAKELTMTKQSDGTYVADVDTTSNEIYYNLLGIEQSGIPVTNPQAKEYSHSNFSYSSLIIPKGGKAKIVFDPKKLVQPTGESQVKIDDKHPLLAKFQSIIDQHDTYSRNCSIACEKSLDSGKSRNEFVESYRNSKEMEQRRKEILKQLSMEKEPLLRQLLYVQYLFDSKLKEGDEEIVAKALSEVLANSPIWGIYPNAVLNILLVPNAGNKYADYIEQCVNSIDSKDVKGNLLLSLLFTEMPNAPKKEASVLYRKVVKILVSDKFSDTPFGQYASKFTAETKIREGNEVPKFSFVALEKAEKTYTKESMKGKVYLMDFWATWCGPCVKEMGNLHKAYEKYKDKNFEILSLSFDKSPEDVNRFREGRWKMPWLNSFVENGFSAESVKEFELIGIPTPILIDVNGKIIATGQSLTGEELDKTLSRFLNDSK